MGIFGKICYTYREKKGLKNYLVQREKKGLKNYLVQKISTLPSFLPLWISSAINFTFKMRNLSCNVSHSRSFGTFI